MISGTATPHKTVLIDLSLRLLAMGLAKTTAMASGIEQNGGNLS